MVAFLNDVEFVATTTGLADFGIGSAAVGYQLPSTAGAVVGQRYSYASRNTLGEFESGQTVYSGGATLPRTTVLDSSAGFGIKVNFTAAPNVVLTLLADDVREKLTADRTYYVATTGSDLNDGLTSLTPLATVQYAYDFVCDTLDLNGNDVAIQLIDGTYSAGNGVLLAPRAWVGGGNVTIQGNLADRTLVTLSSATDRVVEVSATLNGNLTYKNLRIEGPGLTVELVLMLGVGNLVFDSVDVGELSGGFHYNCWYGAAVITIIGDSTFYSSVVTSGHLYAYGGGAILFYPTTVTAFGGYPTGVFVACDAAGFIESSGVIFSGTGGGAKFSVTSNATIIAPSLDYFPGTVAGTIYPSGVYNNTQGGVREVLTADRAFYVRTDGSDANDGLANTAGGAWLTLQHAMHVIASTLDFAAFIITVNIGSGTFDGFSYEQTVGGGRLYFYGAGSSLTTIRTTATSACFDVPVPAPCIISIDRIKFDFPIYTGGVSSVYAPANVTYGNYDLGTADIKVNLGTSANNLFYVGPGAAVAFNGPIDIQSNGFGSSQGFVIVSNGFCYIWADINFIDTFSYSYGFVFADSGGVIIAAYLATTGNATGPRFFILNSVIQTPIISFTPSGAVSTNDLEFFPGTLPGYASSGFYDSMVLDHGIPVREKLLADRTYYVATTGSDANNGLTALTPFLTIQHAINIVAQTLDIQTGNVTIQVADGDYTAQGFVWLLPAMFTDQTSAMPYLLGNTTTPSNVVIHSILAGYDRESKWQVGGFKINVSLTLYASGTYLIMDQCEFHFSVADGSSGIYISGEGLSFQPSNITITNADPSHEYPSFIEIYGGGLIVSTGAIIVADAFKCTQFIKSQLHGNIGDFGFSMINPQNVEGPFYYLSDQSITNIVAPAVTGGIGRILNDSSYRGYLPSTALANHAAFGGL